MLSVEPESAAVAGEIAKILEKTPETRNTEAIGSRCFSVTLVSGWLDTGHFRSANETLLVTTLFALQEW
jgi:hypothetical protein